MEEGNNCHEDCWHYGCFGGIEGCEAQYDGWGGWPEPREPGQECLYPDKRLICKPIIVSGLEFCAALEGTPILDPKTGKLGHFTELLLFLK